MSQKQYIGLFLGLGFLVLGFIAPIESLPPKVQRALGLTFFALIFWTTEPVQIELSSIFLLLLFPLSGLLTFEQSFAPFAGKTMWLIFAGMVVSQAISETGLGKMAAFYILPHLSRRPFFLTLQLHLLALGAAFIVPSGVVRVLLLMPIGISIIEQLHSHTPDRLNSTVLLSLVCGTVFGGFGILTGAVPNLVVAGQLEQTGAASIYWSTWFTWMFPVVGLGRTILSTLIIWVLFSRKLGALERRDSAASTPTSFNESQRITLIILLVGVICWATDALHQIPPVFVGLFLVLLLLSPWKGPLQLVSIRQINFPFLFYIAALFALGSALDSSGFNQLFINHATHWIDFNQLGLLEKHFALTLMAVPLDFLMDIAAVAAVLTPPTLVLAASHGIAPLAAAMSIGMATTLIFLPYQAAPCMVAYSYRRFSLVELALTQFLISTISLLALYPLNILYWHFLNLI
jgi:anion transporter